MHIIHSNMNLQGAANTALTGQRIDQSRTPRIPALHIHSCWRRTRQTDQRNNLTQNMFYWDKRAASRLATRGYVGLQRV
jgi:hypothetical protein